MTGQRAEIVAGRFAAYRVLELSPAFSDRNGGSKEHAGRANSDGCRIELTLGDVPDSFVIGYSYAVPVLDGWPATRVEHSNIEEPEDEAPYDLTRPDFLEPTKTYLTVACVRDAEAEALPGRSAFWVADCQQMLIDLRRFAETAERAIDLLCARLIASDTKVSQVVYEPRPLFEPADAIRQPVTKSRLTGSATVSVTTQGWAEYDMTALVKVADDAWTGHASDSIVSTPAWWYHQAMPENDPLRRFLFAHWGLEALAAKFCKNYRQPVVAGIAEEFGLPASSLVWPTPEGSDRPTRNIEFQFALMAWALKRSDADADIAQFKALADLRNKVSHGERINHSTLPRHDGYLLLRDYLILASRYAP